MCAAAVLGVVWGALPAELPRSSTGAVDELCLTLSNPLKGEAASPEYLGVLERCSALLPKDAELLAELGAAYESAHSFALAESTYQRALAIDPSYADVRLRLGHLMLQRGAVDAARHQARAALLVQPNRGALQDLLEQSGATAPDTHP
jgi:Flp pilus assembly protein TadD